MEESPYPRWHGRLQDMCEQHLLDVTTMDKGFTVKQLLQACLEEIARGNGDRHILISGDDEGNTYHELFFLFSHLQGEDISYGLPFGVNEQEFNENYIVLG